MKKMVAILVTLMLLISVIANTALAAEPCPNPPPAQATGNTRYNADACCGSLWWKECGKTQHEMEIPAGCWGPRQTYWVTDC